MGDASFLKTAISVAPLRIIITLSFVDLLTGLVRRNEKNNLLFLFYLSKVQKSDGLSNWSRDFGAGTSKDHQPASGHMEHVQQRNNPFCCIALKMGSVMKCP